MPDNTTMANEPLAPNATAAERQAKETPRLKGFGSLYRRGTIWWIQYSVRGKQFRESSKSERADDAMKLLKRRWQQVGPGRFIGPSEERVTMDSLLDGLVADYELNQRRSIVTVKGFVRHLRAAFGGLRALDVTEDRIEHYKAQRLAAKTQRGQRQTKPATVNRELAALRKAFHLAVRQKRLSAAPSVSLLEENNVRQGFLEPKEFELLVKALPEHLQDFARFAYLTGCRKGELQSLTWADVSRDTQRITIRAEVAKNKEARVLPYPAGELADIVERRWKARTFKRPDGSTAIAEFVFHSGEGRSIAEFRGAWRAACAAAKKPSLLFHDLRRSAIRNLDRNGVSQPVGMMISGHKTVSVYRRYRIVSDQDVRDAFKRTQQGNAKARGGRVVAMKAKRGKR